MGGRPESGGGRSRPSRSAGRGDRRRRASVGAEEPTQAGRAVGSVKAEVGAVVPGGGVAGVGRAGGPTQPERRTGGRKGPDLGRGAGADPGRAGRGASEGRGRGRPPGWMDGRSREGGGSRSSRSPGWGDGRSRTPAGAEESTRAGQGEGPAEAEAGAATPDGGAAGAGVGGADPAEAQGGGTKEPEPGRGGEADPGRAGQRGQKYRLTAGPEACTGAQGPVGTLAL